MSSPLPIKKRHIRVSRACESCRKRKVKCSGEQICSQCQKYDDKCVYRDAYRSIKPRAVIEKLEIEKCQRVEIPQFMSFTKSSADRSSLEYFGPTSNFSFVNELNHYLRRLSGSDAPIDEDEGIRRFGMNLKVLQNPVEGFDFTLSNFRHKTLNLLLTAYLETWHVPLPLFKAEDVFNLSVDVWQNESADRYLKAVLYLILSIGAATAHFEADSSDDTPSTLHLARGFYELALGTVPDIFSEVSFNAARILLLLSLSACNLGDTAKSYLYCGYAVRVSIAMGLHKVSKFESNHQSRVWASVWQWEHYWSFCVGKPSSCREEVPIPMITKVAFTASGYGEQNRFPITSEHMRLRILFGAHCTRIHSQIYDTNNDLLTVLDTVEVISQEMDREYFGSSDKRLTRQNIIGESDLSDMNFCRELFWIRIYYLYLKMMVYRPFLIFYAYLNNSKTEASDSIMQKLKVRSDLCVQFAIDMSKFIIGLNRQVKMRQPIFFICTYLEVASTILLFFIVSNMACIPDELAKNIWDVLQDTCSFLSGSSGPYVGSIQIIANDALKSLNDIILNRRSKPENKSYFDRVMQKVNRRDEWNVYSTDSHQTETFDSPRGRYGTRTSTPVTFLETANISDERLTAIKPRGDPPRIARMSAERGRGGHFNGIYEGNGSEPSLERAFDSDIEDFWKQTLQWISDT